MAQRKRRGFTIVELVIVIAVIAILAGVLIPTFISVINKANVASDTSLVKNINEALVAEEVTEGKPATMYEALQLAERNGFTIEKLTPRSTGDIVWNSESNRFALVNGTETVYSFNDEKIVPSAKIWKIVDSVADVAKNTQYSSYIKGTTASGELKVSNGVDIGANTGITTITYTNTGSQDAIIRTNSTDTVVNINTKGSIAHHGQAKEINIAEVAMQSYHEYGEVIGNINVAKGNVEVERGAAVSNIIIAEVTVAGTTVAPATVNDVKVQVKEEAQVNTVQSKVDVVKASDVISGAGAETVATIENGDAYVAYVGKQGYDSFDKAMTAALSMSNVTVTLTTNCQERIFYSYKLNKGNEITIDLNGHEFEQTYAGTLFESSNGTNLTIKNGKIVANGFTDGTKALISSETRSSVYVYNIELDTTASAFFPKGDAAKVIIENSKINAGVYAVGTNSSKVANYGVSITIKNSELSTKGYEGNDGDDCTVIINVSGTLNIEDSKIYGHRMAVFVRAGVANIKNTIISADLNSKYVNDYSFGGGNNVPSYPLVVGDTSSGSYDANAICNLTNVKIVNTNTSYADRFIYMANDGSQYTTELTFDLASSGTTYVVRKGSEVSVNGVKKIGE